LRIESLDIQNFRGISRFTLTDLADMVVIAGPNGCGKSAALDALRLLKSVYGGYQEDEWQTWMGEFQIDVSRPEALGRLLRRPSESAQIRARVSLYEDEREYLVENAETVARELAWQELFGSRWTRMLTAQAQAQASRIAGRTEQLQAELQVFRDSSTFELALTIVPGRPLEVAQCRPIELIFRTYDPMHIGVIDFHSASRSYAREALGGINLDVTQFQQQRQQHLLYNWESKYRNVKTELASEYIRSLISQTATGQTQLDDLNSTLAELFSTFFPDKRYTGPQPQPDGTVAFPVLLDDGSQHDIDELSSGEKEILYGYLRLRNSAPTYSVILLDEPELHLNPGLLQGLPDFYHEKIGRAHRNQLWLVTHSDALLRQSVRNREFSVYHMRTATNVGSTENQAQRIEVESELEQAVVDLVGDLATYKPHAEVIICESEGDAAFDVTMISRLFPEVAERANVVAGGSRKRVQDLYRVLDQVGPTIGRRFFAVVDRDSAPASLPGEASVKHWDRYHIENYLLEPTFVLDALRAVAPSTPLSDEAAVTEALKEAAADVVPAVLRMRLITYANDRLVRELRVGAGDASSESMAQALRPSIVGSLERLTREANALIDERDLDDEEQRNRERLNDALASDEWKREIPGRSILKRFVGAHVPGVGYEAFRNLTVELMNRADHRPEGMAELLREMLP
jgi:predicted ATPase